MATTTMSKKPVGASATGVKKAKEFSFLWTGKNSRQKDVKGEIRATSENDARLQLRRQGILIKDIKKKRGGTKRITHKDLAVFTRQLATMMKAGVPLLQSFEIVAKGNPNPSVSKLLYDIKATIEGGESLEAAFSKHPKHFNPLYCNLVGAGEAAGILEDVLDRLAVYQEKSVALKAKIKSALFYPSAVVGAAVIITAVIMIFVIPAFKDVFASFGAQLPAPTLLVMAISDFTVKYFWAIALAIGAMIYLFFQAHRRSEKLRNWIDRMILKVPVFGDLIEKAVLARWARTLSTMFAAGVPLVESLSSVAGAAGNFVYQEATFKVQNEVSSGTSLTDSMANTDVFPNMVLQMTAIGEESGSLDKMLAKVAEFYEEEVDNAVAAISSLLEPMIMVVLGTLIGGIVIAMYLPIFKLGSAV